MTDKPYWQQLRDLKLKGTSKLGAAKDSDNSGNSDEEKPEKKEPKPKAPIAPKKAHKKIKPRNKKKAKEMKALALNYGPYLEKNTVCVIQSPVCTQAATCVNHKKGRGVNEVLDKKTWEPSCVPCNGYIEQHDQWARENGHKISRHSKNEP